MCQILRARESPGNKTDMFPVLLASEIINTYLLVQEGRGYRDNSGNSGSAGTQTPQMVTSPSFTTSFCCLCLCSIDISV